MLDLAGRLPLMQVSDRLTDVAELILGQALVLAWSHTAERYGEPQCDEAGSRRAVRVGIAGYGKLGGMELGYASDLDLVFLHDASCAGQTSGTTPVDNEVFFRYLDRVRAAGIDVPVVPGLIPIHNFKQVSGFAARTGASVPDWLGHRFEGLEQDQETQHLVAAAVAAEQVLGLVDQGINEFHFYTLNRADLVYAICHLLGLRPAKAFAATKPEAAQ